MFKFTIRELVLLTMIVAMGLGWAIDHGVQASAHETARRSIDLHSYYLNQLLLMLRPEGYSLEEIGPGESIRIRTPRGDVLDSNYLFPQPPRRP